MLIIEGKNTLCDGKYNTTLCYFVPVREIFLEEKKTQDIVFTERNGNRSCKLIGKTIDDILKLQLSKTTTL